MRKLWVNHSDNKEYILSSENSNKVEELIKSLMKVKELGNEIEYCQHTWIVIDKDDANYILALKIIPFIIPYGDDNGRDYMSEVLQTWITKFKLGNFISGTIFIPSCEQIQHYAYFTDRKARICNGPIDSSYSYWLSDGFVNCMGEVCDSMSRQAVCGFRPFAIVSRKEIEEN